MPDQGPIQSKPHVQAPSFESPVKDREPSKDTTRKQTDTGDNTLRNSQPLEQRGIENAEATSNVNQKSTSIANSEKQYISHCSRKAKLEEKKEVTQQLETIRRFITSPGDFNEDCGFDIKFISKSGKEEILLPPEKGLNPERLKKLLVKLSAQVDKFDEAFVQNGRDQELDQAIEDETEQLQEARSKLEQEAPESKALSYQPRKARQYEFTVDLPDWPPAKAKEGFVINLNTPGQPFQPVTATEHPRVVLKPAAPSLAKKPELHPEPNSLELPGIENIRWLSSDAPLFLPSGYPQQEVTATFINGSSDFALPEAAADKFQDKDVAMFKALHSKLLGQIQDGSSGMMSNDTLNNNKITPACIRQCFCDNTGSMGTTFVHVFADNKSQSPHSYDNKNNQVMVLWFPKEGLEATPEVAQKASMEVMKAFNTYQKKAFWYNERPSDEQGPSLERDRHKYDRFSNASKSAKTESITIGARNRKIKTKDPEAPAEFPIVRAARFCSLPHEALSETPTAEMDNGALQGFRTALIASQGRSKESFSGTKFLKTFELPERLSPSEENQKPDKADKAEALLDEGIPKTEDSPQLKSEAELQAELQAELEKEFMEDDDNNLKALTPKSLEEAQIQERAALDERVNSLQTFSNESAKTILEENRRTTLKSDRLYKGKELPTNTGTQIFSLIKEEDNDNNDNVVMLYRAGSEASGSESTQNLEKQSTTHPLQPRKIGNENSKPAISPQKNEQLPESGANYVQTTIQPFALSIKSLLDEHSQNHKSLAGITDTDIMNIIYHASFEHKEGSLKGVDFNILLEINEATWLINRGDIRTLHIPHQNPKVRYLQAVNTDPDVAERLAKVIFEKDEIKPWQLKMAKELPAVTKLPTAEDGAYYLLQTGTALSEFIPDIERIVEGKVKGKQESQREEIIEAITTELSKKQSGQTGITDLQVIGYCFPTAQT